MPPFTWRRGARARANPNPNPNPDPDPNPNPNPNPDPDPDPNLQAMGEAIPALGWVMVEKTPGPHVADSW